MYDQSFDDEQVIHHSSSLIHSLYDHLTDEILYDQLSLSVMNDTQVDWFVTSRIDYDIDVNDDDDGDDEDAVIPLVVEINSHSEQVEMNLIQMILCMVKNDADILVMMQLDHCWLYHLCMSIHLMNFPIHSFPMQVYEGLHSNKVKYMMNTVTLNVDRKCWVMLMMMKLLHQM